MDTTATIGRILLVGTFHFTSKRDVITHDVQDMRSPHRQAELDDLVTALARYQPTKVLLEGPYAKADLVNANYVAYREGARELDGNEVEQVGFRLAAHLGHERIYPVDVMHRWWEPALDELMAAAPEIAALWEGFVKRRRERAEERNAEIAARTVTELLADTNTPQRQRAIGDGYLTLCPRLVDGQEYAGADMTGNWYHRNILIYANILRTAEPGDRMLLFYGAGHIPVLRHLLEAGGEFELDDPLPYLAGPPGSA